MCFFLSCWLVPDLSELRSIPRMSVALAIDIDRCLATWAIHRCKCDEFNIDLQFLPIDSSIRFILLVCALFIYRLVVNRIGPMWPCMNMTRNMHFPADSRSLQDPHADGCPALCLAPFWFCSHFLVLHFGRFAKDKAGLEGLGWDKHHLVGISTIWLG